MLKLAGPELFSSTRTVAVDIVDIVASRQTAEENIIKEKHEKGMWCQQICLANKK